MGRRTDVSLAARMFLATLVGLVLNVVLVTLVAVAAAPVYLWTGGPLFGALGATYATTLETITSAPGILAVLVVSVALTVYRAARAVGDGRRSLARRDDAVRDAELADRVRRLAQVADVPAPTVWVVESASPNCFTVGRSARATLVVTDRLRERLDDRQLDAVLAHELAHVDSHDVGILTTVLAQYRWTVTALNGAVLVGFYALIGVAIVAAAVAEAVFGGRSLGSALRVAGGLVGLYAYLSVFVVVVSTVVLGTARVPRRLSWYREFVADRTAARITGDPAALASALETLDGDARPDEDLRSVAGRALYLLSDGTGDSSGSVGDVRRLYRLWLEDDENLLLPPATVVDLLTDAHPPVDERAERLREMVADPTEA